MASASLPVILPVPHLLQQNTGECLVACVGMVFTYVGRPFSYKRVTRLLDVREYGAFFSDVRKLETLGVSVSLHNGGLEQLLLHVQRNLPIIVPVKTGELPYWRNHPLQFENTAHALVVVGIDEEQIYVNDPALPQAPIQVPYGDFDLARLDYDDLFAVIQ